MRNQISMLDRLHQFRQGNQDLPVMFFVNNEELTPEYSYTLQGIVSVGIENILWTGDSYLIGTQAIWDKIEEDWETLAEDGDSVSLDTYSERVWREEVKLAIVVKMGAV